MTRDVAHASEAELQVEQARADLAKTLDLLKDNLRPRNLITEIVARPRGSITHWLGVYGRFAKHSPLSGVIIGAAALALTSKVRKDRRISSSRGGR